MSLFRSLMMAYVAQASSEPIDLSLQDVYGNPINRSTANCYVISKPGRYKFPVVYGNAIKNGEVNTAAFTNNGGANSHDFVDYNGTVVTSPYIENVSGTAASAQLSIADTDGIFMDISIVDGSPCRYLQFKVNSIPATGANGVLSIKDSSGVIMWSWHIWVWADSLETVEITNSTGVKYNIMPVNLASKYDSDGVHIKNWFYQWGRPNPMLLPSAWNSTTDHPNGSITKTSKADELWIALQNPSTFYYNSASPYNWFGTKSYYNLWDAACAGTGNSDNDTVKTVYDPCPVGWKVPNGNTFTGLTILSSANGIVKMRRYSGDTVGVDFPSSGCRNYSGGSLSIVGSGGYVWLSSAYSQSYAYSLRFFSSGVNPQNNNYRAYGFSVRPVEDDLTKIDTITPTEPTIIWTTQSGSWTQGSNSSAYDSKQWTSVSPGSSGSTVIRCTFKNATSITFNCVYNGESNYDYLTVGALDTPCTRSSYGTSLKGTSGTAKDITFTCDTGEHYVEFCYSKDDSVDTSPDCAVVYVKSIVGGTSNLIYFSIEGTQYQAIEGMNWETWVNSSYNTDGYYITEDCIKSPNGTKNVYNPSPADLIKAQNYTLQTPGGGVSGGAD